MEHKVEVLVELDVDGIPVEGYPFKWSRFVDFVSAFTSEDFGDAGFTSPTQLPATSLQALFLTGDQDFAVKLDPTTLDPATNVVTIMCAGFILILGSVNATLTAMASGPILPANLWGFVAGKQT